MQVRAVADSNVLPRSSYTDSTSPGSSFEVAHFSREAAAAHSRGREPTVSVEYRPLSREAATADAIAVAASRLDALSSFFCGLTPAATCYRRFATHNYATSKSVSEGLRRSPSLTLRTEMEGLIGRRS